jgi:hypothetical protein
MIAALRLVAIPLVADCMTVEHADRSRSTKENMTAVVLFAFKIG